MSFGLLWLEGPLQSWGFDSRFGRRATLDFPTRSGILGMVASAMGKPGEQKEWLEKMRPYTQTVVAYNRKLPILPWEQAGEDAAMRLAKPPLLRDFHMAGAGYDLADPWQDLFVPRTSEGKHPVGTGARMTTRHYLQDMAFACSLELPEGEPIAEAMQHPVWALCLGRKSCIPSDLIWRGSYPTQEETLAAADAIAESKNRAESFRVYDGKIDDEQAEVFTLSDVPVSFGLYKRYADRIVSRVRKN